MSQEDSSFPYVVRNTFIDLPGTADQSEQDNVFSTWHYPDRAEVEVEAEDRESPEDNLDVKQQKSGEWATHGIAKSVLGESGPQQTLELRPHRALEKGDDASSHLEAARPVPYIVRNTFVDLPAGDRDVGFGGVFETWHYPRRLGEDHHAVGDGYVRPDVVLGLPEAQKPYDLEDGEVGLEDGEVDEGEVCQLSQIVNEAIWDTGDSTLPVFSIGSANHSTGTCRPCAWMHKSAESCRNGALCEYCHLCPPGTIKRRKQEKLLRRYADSQKARLAAEAISSVAAACPTDEASLTLATGASAAGVKIMKPCYIAPGSDDHAAGRCKPCAWVHKDATCKNGSNCKYCHLCPPGELKRRKRVKWEAIMSHRAAAGQLSPLRPAGDVASATAVDP